MIHIITASTYIVTYISPFPLPTPGLGKHHSSLFLWDQLLIFLDSMYKKYHIVLVILSELFCSAWAAAAAAKSLQLRPTLCDPVDDSPPGSSVPGIFQARILEKVAISFTISKIRQRMMILSFWEYHMCVTRSVMSNSVNPWTVACQAPLSMNFSRQEHWTEWPFPSLGHLPDPGIEPTSPALQADFLPSEPPGKPENTI